MPHKQVVGEAFVLSLGQSVSELCTLLCTFERRRPYSDVSAQTEPIKSHSAVFRLTALSMPHIYKSFI